MRSNFEPSISSLDELIPQYAENKNELDSYKKICDRENAEIKKLMLEANETEHYTSGYKANYIVSKRESMNEDKLLNILKKHGITNAIRTVEVVDMDALEDYLYNNEPSPTLVADIDNCREVKEVVQLRISKVKEKK